VTRGRLGCLHCGGTKVFFCSHFCVFLPFTIFHLFYPTATVRHDSNYSNNKNPCCDGGNGASAHNEEGKEDSTNTHDEGKEGADGEEDNGKEGAATHHDDSADGTNTHNNDKGMVLMAPMPTTMPRGQRSLRQRP
jgi:hypothetical protein